MTKQSKKCYKCEIVKPVSEFSRDNTCKDRLRFACKKCDNRRSRENYINNKELRIIKYKAYNRTTEGRYSNFKSTAKARNLKVDITYDEHVALLAPNKCHYCSKALQETGSGLDRIDSNIGYLLSNVVPCCKICNVMKNNLETPEFLAHIEKIYKYQRKLLAKAK